MDEYFTAESDIADELRVEASMATPEQQKVLHDAAVSVKDSVIREYQPFIQQEALERTAHVEDRLIFMDREHFTEFYRQWDGSSDKPAGIVLAATFRHGDVIAFNDPAEVWHTFDAEVQSKLIQQFGDEATARRMATNISVFDNLTHEVIHQFQDNSLPDLFLEIGTRFYQRQTTTGLGYGHIDYPSMDDSISLYEGAMSEYGSAVHSVYYGKPVEPALRSKIVSAVMNMARAHPSLGRIAA